MEYFENYFPDFSIVVSPRVQPNDRKRLPGAMHLKDISDDEMKDNNDTALDFLEFLRDTAALEQEAAYTDKNGETKLVDLAHWTAA